jgi:hypothetical protein
MDARPNRRERELSIKLQRTGLVDGIQGAHHDDEKMPAAPEKDHGGQESVTVVLAAAALSSGAACIPAGLIAGAAVRLPH